MDRTFLVVFSAVGMIFMLILAGLGVGYVGENVGVSGSQICKDGEYVSHGLTGVPSVVLVCQGNGTMYNGTVFQTAVNYTSVNSTHFMVNIAWTNGTVISDDVIMVYWWVRE